MKQYAAVTADKYELIMALADNVHELARLTGYSVSTIATSISRNLNGAHRGMRFIKFELDEPPPPPKKSICTINLADCLIPAKEWSGFRKEG